jgi:hypothetical protein
VVLGLASPFAKRALYHWSHTSNPLCSVYFGDSVFIFCPRQPGLKSSYFTLSAVAKMTDTHPHTQLLTEMRPQTVILPTSVSQLARITGVNRWCLYCILNYETFVFLRQERQVESTSYDTVWMWRFSTYHQIDQFTHCLCPCTNLRISKWKSKDPPASACMCVCTYMSAHVCMCATHSHWLLYSSNPQRIIHCYSEQTFLLVCQDCLSKCQSY